MATYIEYMRKFGKDLGQIGVWEPGTNVAPGDYGIVQSKRWQRLGSIWDLLPTRLADLEKTDVSTLDRLVTGTAELVDAGGHASLLPFSASFKFHEEHSLFVRGEDCTTTSLIRIQKLSEALLKSGEWSPTWVFVSEVRVVKRFVVLVGSAAGGTTTVTAKTSEDLASFLTGGIDAGANLTFSGMSVSQYIGRSGPLNMSLVRIKSSWWDSRTRPPRVAFAEGTEGINTATPAPVQVDEMF